MKLGSSPRPLLAAVLYATCLPCCLGSSDQGLHVATGHLGPSESPGVSLISYTVEHTGIYPAGKKGCWEKLLNMKSGQQGRGSLRACYLWSGGLADTSHENGKGPIPNNHFHRLSPLRGHPWAVLTHSAHICWQIFISHGDLLSTSGHRQIHPEASAINKRWGKTLSCLQGVGSLVFERVLSPTGVANSGTGGLPVLPIGF